MSLKPPKKSDMGKSWMKGRQDRVKRIQPEYHLIVTEGTKTEPAYFEAIKNEINRRHPQKIQLQIEGAGLNTVSLFEKAKALVAISPNVYKHVWIVYDTDDFPAEHINEVQNLCEINSNEETEYHALWSNQCIELWFLWHFCYFQSDVSRNEYFPKLSQLMCAQGLDAYRKNREDMYQVLFPYMETAIANAKRLAAKNEGKTPAESAPGTEVYRLVEKLKPYLLEE